VSAVSVQDEVHQLLAPIVATLGVELLEVELTGGTLRVIVDEAGGITTERLAEVNRLVSPILDQHDPVPGRYTLEVSSPGLERPLKRPDHYRRAVGEEIVVKLVPEAEPRRLKGRLLAVGGPGPPTDPAAAGATISVEVTEVDGVELDEPERREVQLRQVATARTVFTWGPGPKPGQPGSKKAGQRPGPRRPGPQPPGPQESQTAAKPAAGNQPRGVR
jgi:ribosome maturation factor RimP